MTVNATTLVIVQTAVVRGWHVDRTATGRLRLLHPNGAVIVFGVEATAVAPAPPRSAELGDLHADH
jgi:hypothetical protein